MAEVQEIIERLHEEYGEPRTALNYNSPLELLVAVILSARNTDKQVNKVTKELFQKYQSVEDYANAPREELAEDISSIGLYNQKSKWIQNACQKILEDFDGEIPRDIDKLTELSGVGRKTANVVLGNAWEKAQGIAVDTHVKRVGERLGMHSGGTPEKIEEELMEKIPKDEWVFISHGLIEHGRNLCKARKPQCPDCFLKDICPSAEEFIEEYHET